jgi:hypothetical protein
MGRIAERRQSSLGREILFSSGLIQRGKEVANAQECVLKWLQRGLSTFERKVGLLRYARWRATRSVMPLEGEELR